MASTAIEANPAGRLMKLRFILAIFCGSFLLFLVQPMIARMALPRLGGAPAVWNSAMLVYQLLLLGGYAYAHWLGRFAPRTQGVVHIGLLPAAAMMPTTWRPEVNASRASASSAAPWSAGRSPATATARSTTRRHPATPKSARAGRPTR